MGKNTFGYSVYQITLHWLIAALVLFQLFFGESMTAVRDAADEEKTVSATDQTLGSTHYWVGLVILGLVLVRLAVRFLSGVPVPAASEAGWMQTAARVSHGLFYVLLIATPILGLLAYYVGDPFGDIHSLNKPAFIVLIVIHSLAALFHQFWLKDGTLVRMLRPSER